MMFRKYYRTFRFCWRRKVERIVRINFHKRQYQKTEPEKITAAVMSAHNIISILWDLGRFIPNMHSFNCKKIYKKIFNFCLKLMVDILGWLHLSSLKGDESSQFALVEQKKSDWGQKFLLFKQFRPTTFNLKTRRGIFYKALWPQLSKV